MKAVSVAHTDRLVQGPFWMNGKSCRIIFTAIIGIEENIHRNAGAHRSAPLGSNDTAISPSTPNIGFPICQFKSVTTHRMNEQRRMPGIRIWQRGYFERIVRNEVQLDNYRKYIRNNKK